MESPNNNIQIFEKGRWIQNPDEVPSVHSIGIVSGRIWNYLNECGKTSIIKLKLDLSCTGTVIHLALGWLLKEDKIEFSKEAGQLYVRLK